MRTNRRSSWFRGLVAALLAAPFLMGFGCAVPVSAVASHALSVGPDKDVDVVWIRHNNRLYRCTNTEQGPVCVPAKVPK